MTGLPNARSAKLYNSEILRQFFEPAENDYLAARLLFCNRMESSFVWTAGQCLEKYLKAALLVRHQKIKKEHSTLFHFRRLVLWNDVELPVLLKRDKRAYRYPAQEEGGKLFHPEYTEKLEAFLQRFDAMYHPNQRYGRIDHSLELYDLFKFDQVVYHVRGTVLSSLGNPEEFAVDGKRFGRTILARESTEVVTCLKTANYVFFPEYGWNPHHRPLPWYSEHNATGWGKYHSQDCDFNLAVTELKRLGVERQEF